MTKLTKSVQDCGLHCSDQYFISEADARKAIEVMREAFIEAVEKEMKHSWWNYKDKDWEDRATSRCITTGAIIKAIQSVK